MTLAILGNSQSAAEPWQNDGRIYRILPLTQWQKRAKTEASGDEAHAEDAEENPEAL